MLFKIGYYAGDFEQKKSFSEIALSWGKKHFMHSKSFTPVSSILYKADQVFNKNTRGEILHQARGLYS